ncbi:MAG: type IV pilus biogenesis protein PilM [Planctomycetaceae bacterium]
MSDFIALEWENTQVCGVEASVGRGKVRIDKCFQLKWPEGTNPADQPQQSGRWLKDELARLGIVATTTLISLPREEAVVRPLDLPQAPDDELPDLVRFQAATKSTVPLDRLLLDYLPLPNQPDAEGRSVLLATVSKQLADRIRTVTTAAGLELSSIGIGAVAAAEVVVREETRRGQTSNAASLVIARLGKRIELAVIINRLVVFAHTTRLSGTTPEQHNQAILAEISRSVVALGRTIPDIEIARAWLIGTENENPGLAEKLSERIPCEVNQGLDPFAVPDIDMRATLVPEERGVFAGPVGLLLSKSGQLVEAVDFLSPRKPVVKQGPGKKRLMIAGIAAGFLALAAGSWYWMKLSGLDYEIAKLRTEGTDLELKNKKDKDVLDAARVIGDWDARNVHWLEQTQHVIESLGGRDRSYLERLHFAAAPRGPIAKLQITGFAKGRPDSDLIDKRLVDRNFSVQPHAAMVESKDSEYPYRIELDVELAESKKTDAKP